MRRNSFITENGLHLSFAFALAATLGSLYFSEIMQYTPCKLCWLQRIFMYPLVIILGIASIRRDDRIAVYVLPLSIIGGCISIYHYILQKTTWFGSGSSTCGDVPCNNIYVEWFGFITIPFMALIAFVAITVLQIGLLRADRRY